MSEREGIIGHGDIAKVLPEREGFLFFASGVSNSREDRESEYQREKDLLLAQDRERHLVYFSSLCVFYADTRYAQHKREMEQTIKDEFDHYTIVRIGNITWGDNPNTIVNYFRRQKERGEPVEIQNGYRYLVDKSEFLHWIDLIPEWNAEMNITGQRVTIKEIYENA
jgi:nucleoside-diphosphate-sugar epimerase